MFIAAGASCVRYTHKCKQYRYMIDTAVCACSFSFPAMPLSEIQAVPRLLREITEAAAGVRSKKRKLGDRDFNADTDWTMQTLPKTAPCVC